MSALALFAAAVVAALPVDKVLSSGTPVHALRTDGLRAVFLDRDVRTVEGRPAPAAATSVVTF